MKVTTQQPIEECERLERVLHGGSRISPSLPTLLAGLEKITMIASIKGSLVLARSRLSPTHIEQSRKPGPPYLRRIISPSHHPQISAPRLTLRVILSDAHPAVPLSTVALGDQRPHRSVYACIIIFVHLALVPYAQHT